MAEVLVSFDAPIADELGTYRARAVGGRDEDGMWNGWLEFANDSRAEVLVTARESRQPEREHLVYWATGLTPVYLEGALRRARCPLQVRVVARDRPRAVLDPFEVGTRSLDVLRQELGALNRPRLEHIIAAYDLNAGGESLDWMSDPQLVSFIVTGVAARLRARTAE